MLSVALLPHLNAILNSASAVLLFVGHRFIKRGDRRRHRISMLAAFATSSLFLLSYLTYHYVHGTQHFQGEGFVRGIYFLILGTHTILAAVIVPMVLVALTHGLKGRYDKHRRIARWTYPVWLYVSVTGVVIYLLLYQLYPVPQSL